MAISNSYVSLPQRTASPDFPSSTVKKAIFGAELPPLGNLGSMYCSTRTSWFFPWGTWVKPSYGWTTKQPPVISIFCLVLWLRFPGKWVVNNMLLPGNYWSASHHISHGLLDFRKDTAIAAGRFLMVAKSRTSSKSKEVTVNHWDVFRDCRACHKPSTQLV